ncbi:MAG: phospholipase D family protein [Burkholderiaceae bacterium]|nr:phospholipase D family protein [Burkholderiaceae bacterium]
MIPHAPAATQSCRTASLLRRTAGWLVLMAASVLAGCASLPPPDTVQKSVSHAWAEPQATRLGRLAEAGRPAGVSYSGFRLLGRADSAYVSRIALVDAAEKTLDLQYYAIKQDASSDALLARVREAAARGVRVRILLDDLNASGRDAHVLRLMADRNIEIRMFNPLPGLRGSLLTRILGSLGDVDRIQRRMHNKVFIADNALAITGGRNLGDAYFGQGQDSNFVDLDILAAGPVVREMSKSFDEYWNDKLAYPIESLLVREDMLRLLGPVPEGDGPPAPDPDSSLSAATRTGRLDLVWAPSLFMVDKPGKLDPEQGVPAEETQDTLVDGLLSLMRRARSDLLIVSPYFVPGPRMMEEFAGLRQRGIRVRVLTNSLASNDAPIAHVGYARYRRELLRLGVELYEMRAEASVTRGAFGSGSGTSNIGSPPESRASLHAKSIVMDGRVLVVGSMNLDLRSQLQNSEIAIVIRSAALSAQATAMVQPTLDRDAWRMELTADDKLIWHAPSGVDAPDARAEPGASTGLKLLLKIIGPLAPDEML